MPTYSIDNPIKVATDIGTCIGTFITASGVFLAYFALKAQHEQLEAQRQQMKADEAASRLQLEAQTQQMKADQDASRLQRKLQYEQMKADQEANRQQRDVQYRQLKVDQDANRLQLQAQYDQMREQHDWNRRQFAGQMLAEWNEQILPHRKAIEAKYAAGINIKAPGTILSDVEAERIYKSKPVGGPEMEADWEMRFHLISLFNYFEFVAVVYKHSIADEALIERSFKPTMIKYYEALNAFIQAVTNGRSINDAWGPYVELVQEWTKQTPIPTPKKTGEPLR